MIFPEFSGGRYKIGDSEFKALDNVDLSLNKGEKIDMVSSLKGNE